jgi:predicted transcriptional regulator
MPGKSAQSEIPGEGLNQKLQILEGISRGERDVEEGKVIPHHEAKSEWLNG